MKQLLVAIIFLTNVISRTRIVNMIIIEGLDVFIAVFLNFLFLQQNIPQNLCATLSTAMQLTMMYISIVYLTTEDLKPDVQMLTVRKNIPY